MTVSTSSISALLVQLFRIHNRVSLPGLGAFVAEYQSATFSNDGMHIDPPSKKVVFRATEIWNDGYLEESLAAKENISKEEAKKELKRYIQKLSADLNSGEKIMFNDFGTLYQKPENIYYFELAQGVNLLPESFGLQALDVKPVSSGASPIAPIMPLNSVSEPAPTITPLATPAVHTPPSPANYAAPKPSYTTSSKPSTTPHGNSKKPFVPPPVIKKNKGIAWWVLLVIVILLVAASFVFKKQLTELFDNWYYTPEEKVLLEQYDAGERG